MVHMSNCSNIDIWFGTLKTNNLNLKISVSKLSFLHSNTLKIGHEELINEMILRGNQSSKDFRKHE